MPRWFQVMFGERVILLGTASLFALAAASAIQFVAPTYRAELTLGSGQPSAAPLQGLQEAIEDPALRARLAAEGISFEGKARGPLRRLLQEIEAVRSGVADATILVWADGATDGAHLRISGNAPAEEPARDAVARVGDLLAQAIGGRAEAPPGPDPSELAALRTRLAAADAALAAANALPAPAMPDTEGEGSERAEDTLDAHRQWLSSLILDPAGAWRAAPRPLDPALEALLVERDRLGEAVRQLELTLLDGHPRLRTARLRLQDLGGEIVAIARVALRETEAERAALAAWTEESEAARTQATAADAARSEEIARATTERDSARSGLEALSAASQEVGGDPAVILSAVTVSSQRPSAVLPASAAAVLGFLLASLFVLMRAAVASQIAAGPKPFQRPFAVHRTVPIVRQKQAEGREGGSREEIVSGLLEAGVRRAVILARTYDGGSIASVDVARRLTLEGRSVLLVDLSDEGRAATAMGVSLQRPTLAGDAGATALQDIVSRDFATTADAVRGRGPDAAAPDAGTLASILAALESAERDYDVVIIEAHELAPDRLRTIVDEDAALLLSVEGYADDALAARLEALAEAGLEPPLLVLPSRRPDGAGRRTISDGAAAPSS